MDTYKVIISYRADRQLRQHYYYIKNNLQNPQAAEGMWTDAIQTAKRLSLLAGSLRLCCSNPLRSLGYHIIHFKKYRYIMLYRIRGQTASIEAVYHESQNYEFLFTEVLNS